jgi:hypothetical protein
MRPESYGAGERAALIGCGAFLGFVIGSSATAVIVDWMGLYVGLDQLDKLLYIALAGGLIGAVGLALAAAWLTSKRSANRNAASG